MYAILDIETTGGQYNQEGVTEIAIYKFDGHEIVDQFISLVNPEIPIQPFVIKLTGINNAMLYNAPKFYDVAKRIIEITKNCIIVAHNVQFDYRILRTEFKRLGYSFNRETLCTVELSKQLIPNQKSYSLGKLVYDLGIPITDRHRANGDALATVKLFKMLLNKDLKKEIVKRFIKKEIVPGISPKLQDITESVPSITGIYYIHKEDGSILFIGKSKNIKKRIHQHFTSTSKINKKIQNEVYAVTYENTGSALIALLKEKEEIRINKPIYNKISKKKLFSWALYAEKDQKGYLNLTLQKTDGRKKDILSFTNFLEGKNELAKIIEEYQLYKADDFNPTTNQNPIQKTKRTALQNGNLMEYNSRVLHFIEKNQFQKQSLMVIDKGRTITEKSTILIEHGKYIGYTFYDLNHQINNIKILKNIITPMENNRDAQNIIQNYIRKRKKLKIINF